MNNLKVKMKMTTPMNHQYVVIETTSSQMQLIQNDTKADVATEVLSSVITTDQADMSASDQQPVIMFKWGSQKKPFRCQLCDMAFDDGTRMCEHMVKHGDSFPQKPFPCKVCPKSFLSAKSLERHTLSHYGQALKRCKFCYKVFANKENLEKHVLVHGGSKPHKCTLCFDQFVYRQGLETHMMTHTGIRPFVCNICHKGFNRKDILERHMNVHNGGGKRYKCVECDKTFSHSFVLKRHTRSIHSGEEEGAYCPVCKKYIKSKENLGRHMKIHTGDRPFKCEHCERSFNQKQHLLDHMVVHTGGTPHQCKVCKEMFKHKRSLNRHLQKHKDKDVVCPKCPMRFTETEEMNKHLKKHESRKFQCKECFLLFKLGSSLKRHYWKAHEEKSWTEDGSEETKQFNNMSTTTDDLHLYNEIVSKYEEEMEKNQDNVMAYRVEANDQVGVTEELLSGIEKEQVILIVLENDLEKLEEGDSVEQEVQEIVARTELQENGSPELLEVRDVEKSSADVNFEQSSNENEQEKDTDGKQIEPVASTDEDVVGKKLIQVTENKLIHPRVVRRLVQRSVTPKAVSQQNQPSLVSMAMTPGQGLNSGQLSNSGSGVVGSKRIVVRKVQQSSEPNQSQRSRTIILQQVKTHEGQSKVILGSTGIKMDVSPVSASQDVTVSTEAGSHNSQGLGNQIVQILQASESGGLQSISEVTMDTAQEKVKENDVQYVTVSAKGDNSTIQHMDTVEGTEHLIEYHKSAENSSDNIGTIIKVEDESVIQYTDQSGTDSEQPLEEGDITQPEIIYTHVADSNLGHVAQLQPVAMDEAELDDRSMLIQTVIDYAERQIRESNQS